MAQPMTASDNRMTDGQIETLVGQLRDAARKHRDEIPSDFAQQGLGVDNLGMKMFAVYRSIVEMMSKLIIRIVKVDAALTPQAALDATGRTQYVNKDVVATIPQSEDGEAKLIYFKPDASAYGKDGLMSPEQLAKEYEMRGLKPDPRRQIADNAADPAFADKCPNGVQWQDANGNWCYASFCRWYDERYVHVYRGDVRWSDYWWFAGVCK